jgi:uncharacterized protein (DUF927 family)
MSRPPLTLAETRATLLPEASTIPAQLARLRCWLTWRFEDKPGGSKPAKVPYRVNDGRRRSGIQGSPEDRDGWGTLVQAINAAHARGHDGIGFALHEGAGVVALDLDHVIAGNGETHPDALPLIAGTYAEVSPSGRGVRAFYCCNGDEMSNGKAHGEPFGFETFTTAGFVTVTGRQLEGHAYPLGRDFPPLPDHVRDYAQQRFGSAVKRSVPASPLASAAAVQPAGDRVAPVVVPGDYFATVNQTAMHHMDRWVPALHPGARCQRGQWRIESAELDRNLEEAFSFTAQGIKDWGVHDQGDAREGRRTPIDAVLDLARFHVDPEGLEITSATDAAHWLCEAMGLDPSALGWRETFSFKAAGGTFNVRASGVTFKSDDLEKPSVPVCGWLRVTGMSRDQHSRQWGRATEWFDPDSRPHKWTVPAALLEGDGLELRRQFREGGLELARPHRGRGDLFLAMLAAWPTDARLRAVTCTGWQGSAFVLPDQVIGQPEGERITLQSEQPVAPAYARAGTLYGWRDHVGTLAEGNPLLMFAMSVAFAAPMLEILGEQSGGFHMHGSSTTGKTTTLRAAASIYGDPARYVRTWRATANGLEGVAAVHSDVMLALDEIGEASPDDVGAVVYMLANQTGKVRAARSGVARPSHQWRLLYLSSGEVPLAEVIKQGRQGRAPKAGQELRLADIAVPAEGVFKALHGSASAADFARHLADAFIAQHGHVGVAWIRHLSSRRTPAQIVTWQEQARHWIDSATNANTHAQALRVARRFALAAVAGEAATAAGLTGWQSGAASEASRVAFNLWHEAFGKGPSEGKAAIQRLHRLITEDGRRFEAIAGGHVTVAFDRAGFYVDGPLAYDDGDGLDVQQTREWLVLPEVFKREVCGGANFRAIVAELRERDILIGQAGKSTQKRRIPNLGCPDASFRVYVVDGQALADAAEGD